MRVRLILFSILYSLLLHSGRTGRCLFCKESGFLSLEQWSWLRIQQDVMRSEWKCLLFIRVVTAPRHTRRNGCSHSCGGAGTQWRKCGTAGLAYPEGRGAQKKRTVITVRLRLDRGEGGVGRQRHAVQMLQRRNQSLEFTFSCNCWVPAFPGAKEQRSNSYKDTAATWGLLKYPGSSALLYCDLGQTAWQQPVPSDCSCPSDLRLLRQQELKTLQLTLWISFWSVLLGC